jgi:hypothetical protein
LEEGRRTKKEIRNESNAERKKLNGRKIEKVVTKGRINSERGM